MVTWNRDMTQYDVIELVLFSKHRDCFFNVKSNRDAVSASFDIGRDREYCSRLESTGEYTRSTCNLRQLENCSKPNSRLGI